ncbi:3'-5' exonuclease, partial [Klebsiella oxytoca]
MTLWEQFDRLVIFDTETTGVDYGKDRIIEIGAVSLENGTETGGMDLFIRLPEGRRLDPFIVQL